MSLITATSLAKSFGAEEIFRDVSFAVAKGARFALVGPNGIGKTTLLRILMGLEVPSAGKVTRAKAVRLGYLPQEADFQLEGTIWEACASVFADLIRQQAELERLEGGCLIPGGVALLWPAAEEFTPRYIYRVGSNKYFPAWASLVGLQLPRASFRWTTRAYLALAAFGPRAAGRAAIILTWTPSNGWKAT
jgi:energy-coupling factor transporter ATP-binding protein EcfA2